MVIEVENAAVLSVLAVAIAVVSKLVVTFSLLPKPVPLRLSVVVGGPDSGERVITRLDARAI
jgi:Na+-transporting methylmalonyl-CoA/oxaloacetate decarboxylase gamma subunit